MSMEESISLEETNKIRISLGLKPLTDDKEPADDKDKQAEHNYAKVREREVKERQSKKIQDRINKVRNRRELNASLKGATLGDPDGDVEDTLKWLKRSKKKEKELAKKRQEELENMDKMFQGQDYTEKDLVGLKVSHDFEEMDEGEARILTLKDSRIFDNEEDELQNVEMAEDERTKKSNEFKIKRRDYTGYDDEEFMHGNPGMKRSVLSKYDEDIMGSKETDFRLGSSVSTTKLADKPKTEGTTVSVNKALLSIDYAKNLETDDYSKEGDVGFKKPKMKKKRPNRRVPLPFDAIDGEDNKMPIDNVPIVPRPRDLNMNFVDDDELQAALARSRRSKIHNTKKLSPEEVAKRIAEERAQADSAMSVDPNVEDEGDDGDTGGLTFDDTSEFVRSITYNPLTVKTEPAQPALSTAAPSKQPSPSREVSIAASDEAVEELEAGELVAKDEEDEEAMLNAIEDALKATEAEESSTAQNAEVGTSSEQTFSSGMASTLNILRQQGILATPTADQVERERTQLQRDLWLANQRRLIAQREMEKLQSRGANKDQAQREYENRLREQQEARENLETFAHYKPDINIVYYDEFGRALSIKESWKALSHKFHGKGSGKMKTEKRLKKIAEEKKKEAMASGDTPLSMNRAFQIRQEKTGQAHFVLSVGNRGAVPQAAEFLDPQPLSKGKTEKAKNKKKDAAKAKQGSEAAFMTLPAPQPMAHSESPGLSSEAATANNGMLVPPVKRGFSKITSSTLEEGPSSEATGASDRTKVAFGFGTKRKANLEAINDVPSKRR